MLIRRDLPIARVTKSKLTAPTLSRAEEDHLLALRYHMERGGLFYHTGYDEFEKALGDGPRSRKRLLKKLEKMGLVSFILENGGGLHCSLSDKGFTVASDVLRIREQLCSRI